MAMMRRDGHVVPFYSPGITGAVHFLVMAAGVFGDPGQVFRERQLFQHGDRLHDVVVDLELSSAVKVPRVMDRLDLAQVVFVFWKIETEAEFLVIPFLIALFVGNDVVGPVVEQGLADGKLDLGRAALRFISSCEIPSRSSMVRCHRMEAI